MVVYQSPVLFDRHMTALTACGASKGLKGTLLSGEPSHNDALTIIEGPPGTGKTTMLIDTLVKFHKNNKDVRILVCSPTNVGICDIFTRATEKKMAGHLFLAKQHITDGSPTSAVDLDVAKVVFCTISKDHRRDCGTSRSVPYS